MSPIVRFGACLALGAALGCGGTTPVDASVDDHATSVSQDLYVTPSLWPRASSISVCWENPTTHNARERDWVRDAVWNSWDANSLIGFSGWGACADGPADIHVVFSDACLDGTCSPHTMGVGPQLRGRSNAVVLLFDYSKHWAKNNCQPSAAYHEGCTRTYAVHEFGHVLGFAHEQSRPDTPSSCKDKEPADSNATAYGPWDNKSVMNYCADPRLGYGFLSANDVKYLREVYGDPLPGEAPTGESGRLPPKCSVSLAGGPTSAVGIPLFVLVGLAMRRRRSRTRVG